LQRVDAAGAGGIILRPTDRLGWKMKSQLSHAEHPWALSRRAIPALGLGLFLCILIPAGSSSRAYADYDLPYSPDDPQFAQVLMREGFEEEATRVYEASCVPP
jgi:hypothetical protein